MHLIADAFLRAPVFTPSSDEVFVNNVLVQHVTSDPLMKSLSDFAACDPNYLAVIDAVVQGKKVTDLPPTHPAKQYRAF